MELNKERQAMELMVCSLAEIENGQTLTKFFDEIKDELLVFLDQSGSPGAFSSVCPHLAGEVIREKSGELACKWHGLRFSHEGIAKNCKAKLSLQKYETFIRDSKVYVKYEL